MSQENVEIVRRAYEVLNPRDLARVPEFIAPDIEIDLTRNRVYPAVVRGYEGIERFVRSINDVWDDFRFDVKELIDAGDHVVATVKLLGTGRGSGISVNERDTHVWTTRDGRCTRGEAYRDRAEALKAIGLAE